MDRVHGRIVVVGAGLAGLTAAETLRREGYPDEIVVLGGESSPPYDRPPLSKGVLTGAVPRHSVFLREPAELAALHADFRFGEPALALDAARRVVRTSTGDLACDGVVLATGSVPRRLPLLATHRRVHVLRTLTDADRLRAALLDAKRVAVLGCGFIGSEVASSARQLGIEVTIVDAAPDPLARVLGPRLGTLVSRLHPANGTRLLLGRTVSSLSGTGPVTLTLGDGERVVADVVVVGVGAAPDTAWLAGSGLHLADGVRCGPDLNAGAPGVYAAGDVARRSEPRTGRTIRAEHRTNAVDQGRHAALNLLHGTAEPYRRATYVWSDQYGLRLQFAGSADGEVEIVQDEPDGLLALYRRHDTLTGIAAIGHARTVMAARTLIEAGTSWQDALGRLRQPS